MNLKGIIPSLGAKPGQVVSNPYARAFAPQPTIKEAEGEDHEVSMANNSIDTIIKMATELKAKMGKDEKQIPAWIQDHIAKAENLISQASGNYHEYGDSNESVINEDTRRVKLLGIDFKVSEMNGRIFFSFVDKKAASVSLRQVGTNKIVNHIQNRLDIAYGKGTFFFKSGDHAEFQNGYLFQRNTPDINLNKLKFESVNEARLTDIVRSIVETPAIGKPIHSKMNEAKKYDIGSGYMGNGLTIWNRAEEEHGDYKIIAHISPQGKLSVRDKQLPSDLKKTFQIWADSMAKGNMGPKH